MKRLDTYNAMTGQYDHVDTEENKYAHMQKAAPCVHDFIAETIEQCSQLAITSIAIFRKQTLDTHCQRERGILHGSMLSP